MYRADHRHAGAELLGIDTSRKLDERTIDAIRHALLEHGVIFFRDRTLDIARHKDFASRSGELFLHPNIAGNAADPAIPASNPFGLVAASKGDSLLESGMRSIVAACGAALIVLVLEGCDVLTVLHGFPEPKVVTGGALPIELSYREGKGGLVILSGRVNGKVEVDFVLDTGAPVTVMIDSERTAALGFDTSNAKRLGPSDDPAVPIGVIRGGLTLAFGALTLGELTAVVLPESSLACPERFRTTGFAGAIGADLFRRFVVEVDPKARRVRLHEPGTWKVPPGAVEVPITFERGHPFVDTTVTLPDGRFVTLPMHLDSGMTSAIALVADRDSVLAMPEDGEVTRACFVSGLREVRSGPAVSVGLGGATFPGVATSFSTKAGRPAVQQRGAVGSGLLSQRPYAVDYPGKRLVLM